MKGRKTYFISDAHLGVDGTYSSKARELMLVDWLDQVKNDAEAIDFLGDMFDHWFEYKYVIPRGFSDIIGKLAELRRMKVPIYFFTGNHDMWMFGFFEKELGIPVIRKPLFLTQGKKTIYLNHGDGLKNGPWKDRLMKAAFANPFLQWCYARLHPNFAIGIMKFFSTRSRISNAYNEATFDPDKEYMIDFANSLLEQNDSIDYIIMGHRHLPIDFTLKNGATRYVNLGDWINYFSFAVLHKGDLTLQFYKDEYPVYPIS